MRKSWDDVNEEMVLGHVLAIYEQGKQYYEHGDMNNALECFYESIDRNSTFILGKSSSHMSSMAKDIPIVSH